MRWYILLHSPALTYAAVHRRIASAAGSQAGAIDGVNPHLGCTLRRCSARDYGAVLKRSGRPGNVRSHIYRAERTVLRRMDADRVGHLRTSQCSGREMRGSAVDSLAVHEGVAIRHGYGIHVAGVHKIDVMNVGVEHVGVADERVAHVDLRDEFAAAAEPREKRFAEAEREPADSETKPTAEKADKCGAIDRRPINWAWAPAPPASEIVPAPIVVRREAPW